MEIDITPERPSGQWKAWTPQWDGLTCVECGVDLVRDTIWCDDCSPWAAEHAAEKAELGGLSRFEYHCVGNIDNEVTRRQLHDFGIQINALRESEGRMMLTELEARKVLRARARMMMTICEGIRGSGPRGSALRELLVATMTRVIEEEARRLVFG